jgi:Cd2+/Zn2+-exporting ATPase
MTEEQAEGRNYSCYIEDLDCPDCASKIERQIAAIHGVKRVRISVINSRLDVVFENNLSGPDEVEQAIKSLGYGFNSRGADTGKIRPLPVPSTKSKWLLTGLSGLIILAGVFVNLTDIPDLFANILYLAAILLSGPPIFKKGLLAIRNRSLDMNFLMSVAVIGAIAIDEFIEGAAVMFLFSLANLLESFTISKARKAIESLMDLSPKQATVKRNGTETKVPVEELGIGETVFVKPGEGIPVDGRIVSGTSNVDQSPITGESIPVSKSVGNHVYAGTINKQGFLEIIVEKEADDSTLSRILHMVEEAQVQKAPAQRAIDRFSRIYTPLVVLAAIVTAVLPPLVFAQPFDVWFYRALVLLVVACPCALVISTPISIISGLTSAARQGILIKGGAFLELMGQIDAVAFDKTGTVTHGRPEVTGIHRFDGNISERDLLKILANLESRSEHPLAEAILKKASLEGIVPEEPEEFMSLPGEGIQATVNGKTYFAGSHRLIEQSGLCSDHIHNDLLDLEREGKTVIFVGSDGVLIGAVTLEDQIRHGLVETLEELRENGIQRLVMLTGDNMETARAIARRIGIDGYRAEQLPQDKVTAIEELKAKHEQVAMVGDGINDAPALASASVGIAMGVIGSDAALETADIALMSDDLSKLPVILKLGKRTLWIIRQNIAFALVTKIVFLTLAPLGYVNLWMAVAADMGASLLVIFNGLRLLTPISGRNETK